MDTPRRFPLSIPQAILGVTFLATGAAKLVVPPGRLASHMSWVEHVEDWHVKAIGGIEVAGAAGVMLPALTGIAQSIIPLAAAGLTATMVGAAITNIRSGEPGLVPINAVLIGLAVSVARRARGDAVAG